MKDHADRFVKIIEAHLNMVMEATGRPTVQCKVHTLSPRYCVIGINNLSNVDVVSKELKSIALKIGRNTKDLTFDYPLNNLPNTAYIEIGFDDIVAFDISTMVHRIVARHNMLSEIEDPTGLRVPVGLGTTPVVVDFDKAPHLLIGGATGSGKSVLVRSMIDYILSYCWNTSLVLVDPKCVEFADYDQYNKGEFNNRIIESYPRDPNISRVMSGVDNIDGIATMIEHLVEIMEYRYEAFAKAGARNLSEFNGTSLYGGRKFPAVYSDSTQSAIYSLLREHSCPPLETLDGKVPRVLSLWSKLLHNRIVVVVDEVADLMLAATKYEKEQLTKNLIRIAQKGRAAGIHLILATQRPSVDAVPGLLKANIPGRIALKCSSNTDSNTIIDRSDAAKIRGAGDALFSADGGELTRFQAPLPSSADRAVLDGSMGLSLPLGYMMTMIAAYNPPSMQDAVQNAMEIGFKAKTCEVVKIEDLYPSRQKRSGRL